MVNKVLGGGTIDGQLGVNPDWLNISAEFNRQLWSIDDQGRLVGWIVETAQAQNGNLLANGLYANPAGVTSDANVDNAQIEANSEAIKALLIAQGLSGNYGFFADGFTYNAVGDVGIDVDGKIYTYAGSDPLPVNVAPETNPVGNSDYQVFTELKTEFETVDDAVNYKMVDKLLDKRVYIKEREAYFNVVLSSSFTGDGDGFDELTSLHNIIYGFHLPPDHKNTPEMFGASRDLNIDSHGSLQRFFDVDYDVSGWGKYYSSQTILANTAKIVFGSGTITSKSESVTPFSVNTDDLVVRGWGFTQDFTGTPDATTTITPLIKDEKACNNVVFHKVRLFDSKYFGALIDKGGNYWTFSSPSVKRTGRDGIDIRGGIGHQITHPFVEVTGDDAIVITNRRELSVTTQSEKSSIIGGIISKAGSIGVGGSGIRLGGKWINVVGTIIDNPNRYGVAISSLDADASVRPDDINITDVQIIGLNQLGADKPDTAGYLFRDVDKVTITGGCILGSEDGSKKGAAYYFSSNFTGAIGEPRNQDVTIKNVDVSNVIDVVRTFRFGVKNLTIDGGIWDNYTNPTAIEHTNTYSIGKFRLANLDCRNATNNPVFIRKVNEAVINRFECDNVQSENNSNSPISFGNGTEVNKILKSRVKDNKFDSAPAIDFTEVEYSEYDGDRSTKTVASGSGTFFSSTSQTVLVVAHGLSSTPNRQKIKVSSRSPVAVAITSVDSTNITFEIASAPASNVIIDWSVTPNY